MGNRRVKKMADKRVRIPEELETDLELIKVVVGKKTESKTVEYLIRNFNRMNSETGKLKLELEKERAKYTSLKSLVVGYLDRKEGVRTRENEIIEELHRTRNE